jgi:predicted component of type VI protein secretion system
MYSEGTRRRAFELYSLHRSILKVVDILRKEIPEAADIDRKTVGKWRREDDWDSRVKGVQDKYFQDRDAELAERMEEYQVEFDDTIDRVFMTLKDLSPKSFSEAVFTLRSLIAQRDRLRGEAGETDREEIIARAFKALNGLDWFKHAMADGELRRQALAAIENEFRK